MEGNIARMAAVFLIGFGLMSGSLRAHEDNAYTHSALGLFTPRMEWMKSLPDTVRLSELALPGTHDSSTFNLLQTLPAFPGLGYTIYSDIVVTQAMDFERQLRVGIRVLDLRLRSTKDGFRLYHGPVDLHLSFESALDSVKKFLKANPSETVLIRVREEQHPATDFAGSQREAFDSFMQRYQDYHFSAVRLSSTLGQARGKFVVLWDHSDFNRFGLRYSALVAQDKYSLTTNWDLHSKVEEVVAHLKRASTGEKGQFYINYLSGSGGAFPYFVASGHVSPQDDAARLSTGQISWLNEGTNPHFPRTTCLFSLCTISFEGTNTVTRDTLNAISAHLPTNQWSSSVTRTVGIVMADFPGDSLIGAIIENNVVLRAIE